MNLQKSKICTKESKPTKTKSSPTKHIEINQSRINDVSRPPTPSPDMVPDETAQLALRQMVLPELSDAGAIIPIGFSSSKFASYKNYRAIEGAISADGLTMAIASNACRGAGYNTIGAVNQTSLDVSGSSYWTGYDILDFATSGIVKDVNQLWQVGTDSAQLPQPKQIPGALFAGRHMAYQITPGINLTSGNLQLKVFNFTGVAKSASVAWWVCTSAGASTFEVNYTKLGTDGTVTLTSTATLNAGTTYYFGLLVTSPIVQTFNLQYELYYSTNAVVSVPDVYTSLRKFDLIECTQSSLYQVTGFSLQWENTSNDLSNGGDIVGVLQQPGNLAYTNQSTDLFQAMSLQTYDRYDGAFKHGCFVSGRPVTLQEWGPTTFGDPKLLSRRIYIIAKPDAGAKFLLHFNHLVVHYGVSPSYSWRFAPVTDNDVLVAKLASQCPAACENPEHLKKMKNVVKTAGTWLWRHKKQLAGIAATLATLV